MRVQSYYPALLLAVITLALAAACSGPSNSVLSELDTIANHEAETAKAARAIHHSPSREDWRIYFQAEAESARKQLDAAKEAHAKLDAQLSPADRQRLEPYHEALSQHHAKADEHLTALQNELKKPDANEQTVRDHAGAIQDELRQAEAARKAVKSPAP